MLLMPCKIDEAEYTSVNALILQRPLFGDNLCIHK